MLIMIIVFGTAPMSFRAKKLFSLSVKELRKGILHKYRRVPRRCIIQTIRCFVNDGGDIARKY